ncbi:MAG: transmembrane 220 family protein [Bacteroidota bacterium]
MRIVYWTLAALFATFAIVQLNDVDPWIWVTYYAFIAILFGAAALRRFNVYVIGAGLLATIIGLVRLLPEFQVWLNDGMPSIVESMKAETPYVEFIREFLGLLIGLLALVFLFFRQKRERSKIA